MAESLGPHRGIAPPNDGMSAVQVAFPRTQEDFDNDYRVSFDKSNKKWVLEDENSGEWEWNEKIEKWVPSV